jgi:plastocyanin
VIRLPAVVGRVHTTRPHPCLSLSAILALLPAVASLLPAVAGAQSALGHPPNLRAEWPLDRWQTTLVIGHRFEFISGGDELINLPTMTLATGLFERLAVGLDYTSNSEIVPDKLGGNETQYWASVSVLRGRRGRLDALLARNTAARSGDAALTGRARAGPVSLLAEGRAFSNALGTGSGGGAIAGGAVLHLTRYLELSGDVGRMLEPDTLSSVWSAGVALAIPGTRHTLSLHATNVGAATLQGASREKVLGRESVRYGFTFSAPLGSRAQWARIFRPGRSEPAETDSDTTTVTVDMRMLAFAPREITIRAGESVAWVNRDPLEHTVTADDGSWTSALLGEGGRYRRTFTAPGRYTYHCTPHPQMTGVVIVQEAPAR